MISDILRQMSEREESEEFVTSISLGIILTVSSEKRLSNLLLVRDRISQKYGIIAGHLKKGENLHQTAVREVTEELGFFPQGVIFSDEGLIENPFLMLFPKGDKTSLGIIYACALIAAPTSDSDGWKVTRDSDIDYAKPFDPYELIELLMNYDTTIHRPEFNVVQIVRWLISKYMSSRGDVSLSPGGGGYPKGFTEMFRRLISSGKIMGLTWDDDEPVYVSGQEVITSRLWLL